MPAPDTPPPPQAPTEKPPVPLWKVAVSGLCPQCGAKGLFAGLADFAPRCTACGLDFDSFNVGDGPAAFLTLIDGALVTGIALWLHFTLAAPMWVIVLVLVPLTAVLVIGGLRLGKAALLATEYRRRAGEFQSHGPDDEEPPVP